MTDPTAAGPAWVPVFLAALAETGVIARAFEAAGISPTSAYYRRNHNARFAAAWQAALPPEKAAPRDPQEGAPAEPETVPTRHLGWKSVFFETLAETSNVAASAARANVPAATVYKLRRSDPKFAARWLTALHDGYDRLEMELLGYLRDPRPGRKMDSAAALRLLAAHRDVAERRRAMLEEEDEQAVLESIDRFIDEMRGRRAANTAILAEDAGDGAQ